MKLQEFKTFLNAKRRGDLKLPATNEELQPLLQESLDCVASKCDPVDLSTRDLTKETLRFITLNLQIRKPIATILNEEKIDIDEQLVYAVAYDLLSNNSNDPTNKVIYEKKRDEKIQEYVWNNYKLLKELGVIN